MFKLKYLLKDAFSEMEELKTSPHAAPLRLILFNYKYIPALVYNVRNMYLVCSEMSACQVRGHVCTAVPGVWKLSETIWQPAFQKI